jgi:hypothetical protein
LKEILSEIDINASASKTWDVLTDFNSFPQWNPFIRQIDGTPNVGTKIKIYLHTSGGKNRTYQPTVTKVESNRELRWYGKSFIPGFFNGERIFIIDSLETNRVHFVHKEIFTGILVNIIGNSLDKDMYQSFTEMNKALKQRVEQTAI